jgi:hypothetical protein
VEKYTGIRETTAERGRKGKKKDLVRSAGREEE